MKNYIIKGLICFWSLFPFSVEKEIHVNVTGLRSGKGKVILYLFISKKGFLKEPNNAIRKVTGKISNGTSTIVLKNISEGEYAISVFHDENNNDELDTNFIGIPKEGIGTSNNAKSKLGPPSYEESKFQVDKSTFKTNILIKYL